MSGLGSWLGGAWDGIKSVASNAWNATKETASQIWGGLKEGVGNIVSGLGDWLGTTWGSIKETASNAWDNMKSSVSSKASALKESAVNAMNNMKDGIKGVLSKASEWGSDMMSNLSSGISGAIGKVRGAVSNVASVIRSFLHFSEPDVGALSDFHTYMPDMIDLMTKGMMEGVPKVEQSASALGSAIHDGVTDYSGQLGQINTSIKGLSLAGDAPVVYVQISDGQLQRAMTRLSRGEALRSGGR